MPGRFGGATPVGVGRRVTGHLLWVAGLLVSVLLAMSSIFLGSGELTGILGLVGMILGGTILIAGVIAALLWSTSLGGGLLGYRFVDSRTNRPNGPMTLVKLLAQIVFECATVLLGTISYYFTYKDGQHWLDRVFHLAAVENTKTGQTEPVSQEEDAPPAPMGPAMPQPMTAYTASPFSAPPQPATPPGSAFAPPAYGGPASRPAASGQQLRMPQPVAIGSASDTATSGFAVQRTSGFPEPEGTGSGAHSTGMPVYPPTADPIPSTPARLSPSPVPPASAPSPGEAGPGWPVAPTHGMPAETSQSQPDPDPVPARAADPVHPPSPFAPLPFPSPSQFPPSPTSPSRASVFQPPAGSWMASASPVFPPVSPARATTGSPSDPPAIPVPAARAAKRPSLVQDKTVADDGPEAIPEVVLDDGLRIKVDGPLVLGRNPLAPDTYPDARSVRVTDETMRLSKTHMVLRPVDGRVQVIDIGATNGVYIEADQERTRIPIHEPWRLSDGDLVHFGGRTLKLAS